ncbi:MAG TPA: hypothetical protein VHW65_13240 [Gemmatimonadales bacterium]|jgi:hypothetical protein|nr:hypothetical protein [Gemmatimonadales bacterium]
MRSTTLALVPLLAAFAAAPLSAQVAARLHVDVPIRRAPVAVVPEHRLVVHEYAPARYGAWQRAYSQWRPVTVYLYGGQYYDYAVPSARPVVAYRYRHEVFFPPRDREWVRLHGAVRPRP